MKEGKIAYIKELIKLKHFVVFYVVICRGPFKI